jgi:predicted 2-oxoglutarate/Fe(II)-dependent dioxygenase YbiX
LRYDPTNYNYDHKNGKPGLAMDYHTDTHEFDSDSPGEKFIVTATMYLNDDYDGGEVSFLDESSGSVTDYKPKAGDITVFPSGAPYYHGIKPIFGNERYLLRMFWLYNFVGTQEWHKNKIKYGEELWQKMEDERIKLAFESGQYHIVVVQPGETFDPETQKSKPFYVKEVNS